MWNARITIAEETEAARIAARAHVIASLQALADSSDPQATFHNLPNQFTTQRHVRIDVEDRSGQILPHANAEKPRANSAPNWFLSWVTPEPEITMVPIILENRNFGRIIIQSDFLDEANDIWNDISSQMLIALLAFGLVIFTILIVVRRALSPLEEIEHTLSALEAGDYAARSPDVKGPDLAPISKHVNALAHSLEQGQKERLTLAKKLVDQQDEERKEIAMELHDELGPCLFGLRVETESLLSARPDEYEERVAGISKISEQIQAVSRRLLKSLRPMTIGQLPLVGVLTELLNGFQSQYPDIQWEIDLPKALPPTSESIDLAIYRAAQEGITNALKHSETDKIALTLFTQKRKTGGLELCLDLRDHGTGFASDWRHGGGLLGMRNRVETLGGRLDILDQSGDGTKLKVRIPLETA